MKTKKTEFEVDFLGGQESLTKEEEKAISEFLKKRKKLRSKRRTDKSKELLKPSVLKTKNKAIAKYL
ncbi:MAG: hypothetical protein NTV09_00685 [Bacteroidetes bacterium]|nr:hypothetical protein [Bacteroidota bacterium]